jgi:aerobic C4-dicarboxylate transport protein
VHALDSYTSQAKHHSGVDFILNIIPSTVGEAFTNGDILQILFFAILFGVAAAALGERAKGIVHGVEELGQVMFRIVGGVMRLAPLGALGAMAFTVGKYGVGTLAGLLQLLACFYLTAILFVLLVLGLICWLVGVNLFKLLKLLKDELLIVLGTSSSESALPGVMQKLESVGVSPSVVGLVIPMGYSFNLDGTSIYLTLATLFVAQATGTPLPLGEELALLGILLLTSKGAATVTGGGFITLAATLSATGHIPVAGLTLLLGVDRFMSEVRALVNLIGNSVATLVVAKWEGELDVTRAAPILR